MPYQMQTVAPPDMPWQPSSGPCMSPAVGSVAPKQMAMPPMMPSMSAAPKASTPAPSGPDPEVRGLLSMMRGRQAELPEDLQQQVQSVLVKYGRQSTKDLHAAVTALDKARAEYDKAVLARNQQHSSWKRFLSDAVQLWQTYATQFDEQEHCLRDQVALHRDALVLAKKDLESAKLDAGEVHHVTAEEDLGEADPDATAAAASAAKITATMQGLASSLQTLHQEAAAMVEEDAHVAKRPRTERTSPKDRRPRHAARGQGLHYAFWLGWLSTTNLCTSREPQQLPATFGPGPLQVLKWSHSVIGESDFVSEWKAIETGRGLALELGTYDGIRTEVSASMLPSRQSSTKDVGFSNVADVLIGMDDSLDMHTISVDGHCVANGSFPWSAGLLRGGLYQHELPVSQHAVFPHFSVVAEVLPADNTEFPFTGQSLFVSAWRPPMWSVSQSEGEASMHSVMPALFTLVASVPRPQPTFPILPSWGNSILALLSRAGVYDDVDASHVIYVTSYYLNHATHVSYANPRPLRFDEDVHDWEAGVRLVWEDLVHPGQPLDVVWFVPTLRSLASVEQWPL